MDPAVMLGQGLADGAGPVCEGAVADLAAGDRQMGNGQLIMEVIEAQCSWS